MKNNKVTRGFAAVLSGIMLSGQFASGSAVLYAHAESEAATDYALTQKVTSSWYGGYCGEIVLTNLAKTETNGWKITFCSADKIANLWNGTITETIAVGDLYQYTVESLDYNKAIAAGQSISIGYIGEGNTQDFADGKATLSYAGQANTATEAEQSVVTEEKTEPQTEVSEAVEAVTITTADGQVLEYANPYFPDVVRAIAWLESAPEITVGEQFRSWYPISEMSVSSSTGEADFIVYMNTDMYAYDVYPQSEADVYYRVEGTIGGQEINRCVAYNTGVSDLWESLQSAKREQIKMFCESITEFDGYYIYDYASDMILVSADEYFGKVDILTDSDISAFRNGRGIARVHVYDISPATAADAQGRNTAPDLVGKVEMIK